MAPFFASPFHCRIVLVDPVFISNHYTLQEATIFCIVAKVAGKRSHIFPPVWGSNVRYPPCAHSVKLQHVVDGMVTNVQHGNHFFHLNFLNDAFSLCNYLQCYFL